MKRWEHQNKVITWDVTNYYSYLPATFIYGDPLLEFTKENPAAWYDKFVPLTTPSGNKVIKMTMGLSFVYAPFFAIAHILAPKLGYDNGGYSPPYKFALMMSSVVFFLIGLLILRKLLSRFFEPKVVIFTLLVVGLGTNLLYYTAIRSAMSHSYNFALITLFLWLGIKWIEKPRMMNSIYLGLLIGLISLIRPTNSIIIVFLLFYKVKSFNALLDRFKLLITKYYLVLIMLILCVLVWLPQLIYWKAVSGHYFYFSYQGEGFFFNNPQIIKGLFGYRNGWFVYTPLMFFSFVGIAFLFKHQRDFFWPVLIFALLNIYIILSWWCWWYVGYGNRPFIDSYGIMAIPFATLISWLFSQRNWIRMTSMTLIILFICLNLFQTWQYYKGFIQYDSMSKKAYWEVFLDADPQDKFWGLLEKPNYEKALKGIDENLPPQEESR
ncbi:MAG: hypothetical protein ISR55_09030 [Bacteroidetes bacterium]|nr:hypothetical protein [Bacteroidota bacterium]